MCDDDEPIGSVRRLTPDELKAFDESRGEPIKPKTNGDVLCISSMRFVIRPEDWRGFTGDAIKRVDSNE